MFLLAAALLPACERDPSISEARGDFSLNEPANARIGVSGTPTFSWDPSSGATSYTLQVSTNASFAPLLLDQPGILTTSASPTLSLNPGTVYYWRVVADRPSGTVVAVGAPWSFTTVAPTPGPFTLIGPSNGTTGVLETPAFSWNNSLGAASFTLQVSTDPGFGTLVVDQTGILTTSISPSVTLAAGTPYFWRVLAVSDNVVTATGAPWAFTTATASSSSFTLVSPGSGETGVPREPTYLWNSSPGASSYTLQVSTDINFGTFVINQSNIFSTVASPSTMLFPGTVYYWRVLAMNAGGGTNAVSSTFSFTTGT